MELTLEIAGKKELQLLERLLQLHLYDCGMEPGPDGVIDWGESMEKYFIGGAEKALQFREEGNLVGFALVKLNRKLPDADGNSTNDSNFIGEFHVLRPYRRRGLGMRAVELMMRQWPGVWTATTWPGGASVQFWRHVAMQHRGQEFEPGKHKGYPGQYVWTIKGI